MQPAAAAYGAVPEALARVRAEWRERIAAEYTSAAIAQQVTLWLIQLGAPPDLIDAGLAIVADELAHSRMSHEVYTAAGGSEPPAIDRAALELPRSEDYLLRAIVRVFCLGETVAVPLFRHLRERCTIESARAALDRILRDEVRHRDFGWDVLDWIITLDPGAPARVSAMLPAMLTEVDACYGATEGDATDTERGWGLSPPREYAAILAATIEKDYRPRFTARGCVIQV